MQDAQFQELLTQSSLIHIFIVSGSHFLLLHKILAFGIKNKTLALLALVPYAMMTLCQPPAVRSLVFLLLLETGRRQKLFPSNLLSLFLSSWVCVAFFPQWIFSRSFLMSLIAALAMCIGSEFTDKKTSPVAKALLCQIFLYGLMAVCLWGISNLHPLSILLNVTLGTLIGAVIFPLALLLIVFPFFGPLFDFLMNLLKSCLQIASEVLRADVMTSPTSLIFQWIFFGSVLIFCHILFLRRRRGLYET